jgi:hypothetical protein
MRLFALVASLLILSSAAFAAPVYNSSTGHWYRFVQTPATWTDASGHAVLAGGYLAAVGDAAENDFVYDNSAAAYFQPIWLGGRDLPGWQWANGDAWGFTDWLPGEPSGGDALAVKSPAGVGTWDARPSTDALAYVIEHEAPLFPAQPVLYNGHWYQYVSVPATWQAASTNAANLGGYVAVISDDAENNFVLDKFAGWSDFDIWLGGSRVNGDFQWVNGDPWGYANWNTGEPNNDGGAEDALEMLSSGKWNDTPGGSSLPYVIEYATQPLATRQSTWGGIKALYR